MQSQINMITHFNEAINHRITTPGFVQSYCIFISRRIENSNDEVELLFDWRTKYSQQKAGVKLFKQQLIRTQEAQEKRNQQRKKEDVKKQSPVKLLQQNAVISDKLRVPTSIIIQELLQKLTKKTTETPKASKIPRPIETPKTTPKSFTTTTLFDDYYKIKVAANGKNPVKKGWQEPINQTKEPIKGNYNTGIPTGERNNLLVVDVDIKDDGMIEFKKYLDEHGDINTLTVESPRKGLHYYFNFSHASPEIKYIIDMYLLTATNYRGKGIDIRANGGYIVAPPSIRDGKAYKVVNHTKPIDIPDTLAKWLIEGREEKSSTTTRNVNRKQYNYDIIEEQVRHIIYNLDEKYLHNYSDWLIVTSVLKFHDMYDLWDEWSQQSEHYNKTKNDKQWEYNQGIMDINYLIWLQGDKTVSPIQTQKVYEPIQKYKVYEPITVDTTNIKQVTFDANYVSDGLDFKTFEDHDTIIIKSCTGTGKTTCIAKHAKQYMNKSTKFLSITTRMSLSDQHEKSFEEINMQNYQDAQADLDQVKALTICLNSLHKLKNLQDNEIQDYIVYIDEISSFAEFTNNDLLDGIMKQTVYTLTRFLRLAKKVIVSDALINDNTFELLKKTDLIQ